MPDEVEMSEVDWEALGVCEEVSEACSESLLWEIVEDAWRHQGAVALAEGVDLRERWGPWLAGLSVEDLLTDSMSPTEILLAASLLGATRGRLEFGISELEGIPALLGRGHPGNVMATMQAGCEAAQKAVEGCRELERLERAKAGAA